MEEQSYLNLKRGIYFFANGNYTKASEEFLRSLSKKESSMGYALYGASLYWLGDNRGAIENYEKALKIDPTNDIAWQFDGIARAREGDLKKALESFTNSYQINPDRADTLMNMASIHFSLGNLLKAIEFAKKAINKDPQNPLYYYQLGLIKLYEEDLEEAERNFKKASDIDTSYQEAILWNGIAEEMKGKIAEAEKKYEKAIYLKPYDYFARYRLAISKLKRNRFNKEILLPCFELSISDKKNLPLQLSYSAKSATDKSDPLSKMIDDVVKNVSDGDEIKINVDALDEKTQLTLEKIDPEKKSYLSKALSEKFSKQIKKISKTFVIKVNRKEKKFSEDLDRIKTDIKNIALSSSRINISAEIISKNNQSLREDEAVYIPRNIGNDMGLWLVGNPWLYIVEEDLKNLENSDKKEDILLKATGYLIAGDPAISKQLFERLKEKYSTDYADIIYLGLGVTEYLNGNREKAIENFKKAMLFDKSKKIAKKNIKYLDGN